MYQQVKKRVYDILENQSDDLIGRLDDVFLIILILASVVVSIVETVQSFNSQYQRFFETFEWFALAVFTTEYGLRLLTCTINENYRAPFKGRILWALTFYAIIDLLAILPSLISITLVTFFGAAVLINLLFLRAFRLFRIFRVFKLGRYHDSFETIKRVLSKKRGELFVTAFVGIVLLVVASSAMYYAENGAQPDKFSSIPATMWWGVETLTTIGYGDMYPVTRVGQFLAALIAALGIGLFALPAGILGSGFYEEFHHGRQKDETITCPHCGKEITKR